MRIAFIVGAFPTLSETFILNQITGLIDRGHEVDIFSQQRGGTSKIHKDVTKYKLLNCTYYVPLMPKNKILRTLKGILLVLANLHKGPLVLLSSMNIFKYGRQAASLRLLYMILPYVSRKPYDIIHCHFGPLGLIGLQLRDIGAVKGKLITTFHGFDMSSYVRKQGNEVYNLLFERGTLFMPISERWKSRLIELGCDKNKILVHRMGVDCRKLTFRSPMLRKNERLKILTIARLVEKKGVEYGIQAIAKVSRKYKNIEYNIIGDGPLQDTCDRMIEDLNVGHTIHLLGWKDQNEIRDFIANSHIFLAPSVTSMDGNQEGIPVALMEAMAAGLPIISTQHSGIPELVQDGVSGFLVPERDVDALAEKLIYLIEHPEIWPEMGRAGHVFVETKYDISKLNNQLIEIYQELVENDRINSSK